VYLRHQSVTVPDVERGPDPDDWFGDQDPEERRLPDAPPDETVAQADDWLDETVRRRQPRQSWAQTIDKRMVTVAASLIALLIAGLAAAGVFSSGGSPAPLSTPSQTTATQTTTTGTSTAPAQHLPAPATTLTPGDKGSQVVVLQRALARLGFSSGKADGVYGPATTSALKRFQQSSGLKADGILGPVTLRALGQALKNA
jgi:murein L,D-transpeptidase YcbB/YkuD